MEMKNKRNDLQISINTIKNVFQLISEKLNIMEIEKNVTRILNCLSVLWLIINLFCESKSSVLVFLVLLFRDQFTSVGIESSCSYPMCFDIECVMFGDRSLPKQKINLSQILTFFVHLVQFQVSKLKKLFLYSNKGKEIYISPVTNKFTYKYEKRNYGFNNDRKYKLPSFFRQHHIISH